MRAPGTHRDPVTDLVVTGVGLVAPAPPRDPARARPGAHDPAQAGPGAHEPAQAGPAADWFDTAAELGGRGHRYTPHAGRYLLAAARRAAGDGGRLDRVAPARRGAAIATNGGLDPLFATMDATVTTTGADELSPALAPYFAINVLGTRLVAEHGIKGFHLTLTSPRVAAFEAVEAGVRAASVGRCAALLVGAVEDGAEQGAVALVMESAAGVPAGTGYGTVRCATGFVPPSAVDRASPHHHQGQVAEVLAGLCKRVGGVGDAGPEVLRDDSPVGHAVAAAVADPRGAPGRGGPGSGHPGPVTGTGAGCLRPLLRTAELFAGPPGEHLLVVAAATGNVAVARVSVVDRTVRGTL